MPAGAAGQESRREPLPGPRTGPDPRHSSPGAAPAPWTEAPEELTESEFFRLPTIRPEGRPHVTPLLAVRLDGAPHVATGGEERKARSLTTHPQVALTTGATVTRRGATWSSRVRPSR
ncbi:pyridoxamine 5'-phosphate oxidase family protein [Streptomyces sp. NPDC007883]|uniref:pyridoxamine 5'-phosphate oxidase family protein n=1 Tax=Streptomyces sp. NPDC007883 TaxID=3155116 RepID=UPI0033ED2AB8